MKPYLVLLGLCLVVGVPIVGCGTPQADVTPTAIATATATPAPSPTAKQVPAFSPRSSATDCDPGPDVLVRYVYPNGNVDVSALGSRGWIKAPGSGNYTCEPTTQYMQRTTPSGPGYCTQVAWSSDNPGYDVEARPVAPLKKVIAQFGDGCYRS